MIDAIETALLARVQAASDGDALGYALATVGRFGGAPEAATVEAVQGDFPAVWALFSGWAQPVERGPRLWRYAPTFTLVIGAAHGGPAGPYRILADMAGLLVGQRLGLPIDPIEPGPARRLHHATIGEQQLSLYALDLATRFVIDAALEGADPLGDFATFNANWDIPPHGTVSRELPADASADATDRVTLPIQDPPEPEETEGGEDD